MHGVHLLSDLLLLVAVSLPVVLLAHRLRVPAVVGFLLGGILIGPGGLGWVERGQEVADLAELGVVLLLFTIGLELSFSRVLGLGRLLVLGGTLQAGLTSLIVALVGHLGFGLPWPQAIFAGFLVALSSTAIVLKLYDERGEIDAPHGRLAVSILLFQDLLVAPLMLLVPLLASTLPGGGADAAGAAEAWRSIGQGLLLLTVLLVAGRYVVPWVLDRIARLGDREIFTLSILLVGLGAAWLTSEFGLSLALGAFVAGLLVSESPYGLQALSDVLPFRDTFTGIFFISMGMLLDVGYLMGNLPMVLGITAAVILLKATVVVLSGRLLGRSLPVSVRGGLGLAQVGEFSFILAMVGVPLGLLGEWGYQLFLATSVLSMLASPLLVVAAGPLSRRLARMARLPVASLDPAEVERAGRLIDHVIIVGYGHGGRLLARVLEASGIAYIVLEQDAHIVRRGKNDGVPIVFGDGTRQEVLQQVGAGRARALVLEISSPREEARAVSVARHLSRTLKIVVRTRNIDSVEPLATLGANEVVAEEFETSLEIFARVLRLYGVPSNLIDEEVRAARGERYEMLRGLTHRDLELDSLKHLGVYGALETVMVEEGSEGEGGDPVSLQLRRRTGAVVIAAVRDGEAFYTPDPGFRFEAGDAVVLVGSREALEAAMAIFRAPDPPAGPPE